MNASRGVLGWLWRAVGNALEEGQGWVIVTLVGKRFVHFSIILILRYRHWSYRSSHVNHDFMVD
jgi:hypothetical protein